MNALPPLPTTSRRRLTTHYGPAAAPWLDRVPGLLTDAGRRWNLKLTGYHDAGHACALATAIDPLAGPVLVKVWFDAERYNRETAALRLWHPGPGQVVLASDDELSAVVLRMVGSRPGGDEPPVGERASVGEAIQQAHRIGRDTAPGTFPLLADYLSDEILPRIGERRITTVYGNLAARVAPHLPSVFDDPARRTVLHADLYRENVAFTRHGRPVLLDPLPMQGDALFDWAFWTVYYRLGHDTDERLSEAARRSGIARARILPWCLLLALDGLLFLRGDGRSARGSYGRCPHHPVLLRRKGLAPMTTFLLRHASTSYSARHLVNGDPGVKLPLNAEGVAACHNVHRAGSLSHVRTWITSAFPRAEQTAVLLAGPTPSELRVDSRLNELDYGDFEGGPFLDYAAWLGRHGPWERPRGSAESQREAFARMLAGLQGALTRPGPRVIVTHGLLVSLLTWALSELPGTAVPLFFPEAPCLDPLVLADIRLHRLTTRLLDDIQASRAYAPPTGGGRPESRRGGAPALATFDPLRTPPEERSPHA